MKNVLATITEYKALKAQIEQLTRKADGIKTDIIGYMKEKETDILTCGQYTAKLTTCTKTGIDTKRLKAEKPDIASEYETITEYERFTV